MSDSLQPCGRQPTRLCHPWDFPGKNTGVGCHFLLQGIFLTQGLNSGLLHCRQTLHCLSHQGSIGQIVWDLRLGKRFLKLTKSQTIKKNGKLLFIKVKIFCSINISIKRMKRQATDRKEVFSNLISDNQYLVNMVLVIKKLPANARDINDAGSIDRVRKIPWRKEWQPTPVFLPGESHLQRSLAGCSPQGRTELNNPEAAQPTHMQIQRALTTQQ